uniref:Uncharacterized protein n=1 Tax=Globisporangium ultimum (strain ATCC 200006 / CBS 805.95 / DAOM BR144) TaxID=431595 RepID=K3X162_GLOUD
MDERSPNKPPRHPSSSTRRNPPPSAPPHPAYPSFEDDDVMLPPLAVPLGYGSGPMPPLQYDAVMAAQPVYRQQLQHHSGSAAVYRDPSFQSPQRRPPGNNANSLTPMVYVDHDRVPSLPPAPQQMHRPRGSHRAYHQMYRDPQPRSPQVYRPSSKCAGIVYLLKLVAFNALNGVLSVAGFVVVNIGLCFSLVALPLCCFGVVLFRVLLVIVSYFSKVDAVLHNLIASDDDKIQFGARHPHYYFHPSRGSSSHTERYSLLPTQVDWQLQPHHVNDDDQLPQFEKSLEEISPRAILATIYFGSIKLLVGIFSMISIGLMGMVLAFFLDNDEVQLEIHTGDNDVDDPFMDYVFALGLAVFSVALLFANARISQAITRFFCCEGGV